MKCSGGSTTSEGRGKGLDREGERIIDDHSLSRSRTVLSLLQQWKVLFILNSNGNGCELVEGGRPPF